MPTYPTPGKGISTLGINKLAGFGSRNAAGNVLAGHEADQGINHASGLTKVGLDVANNPRVTALALTALTPPTATVSWTTAPTSPAGTVAWRLTGASGAFATVTEAGGPFTAHTVNLTGLLANSSYDLILTQPGAGGAVVQVQTRISTVSGQAGVGLEATPLGGMSSPLDGTQTPVPSSEPTAQTIEETGAAPGLAISGAQAVALDSSRVQVTWRTDAYADGQVDWGITGGGLTNTVAEGGRKRMDHLVFLGGLQPGTTYHLVLTSEDAAGDEASQDVEVTTPAA